MAFWDRIKEIELSYRHELDVIKGRRLSRSQIDSAIYSLDCYKRELASLRWSAQQERNHTAALGRLEGDLTWLQRKIDQLLDTRNRVDGMIKNLEQAIPRLEESLRYDHQKNTRSRGYNPALDQKIREKERKLDKMRSDLNNLRWEDSRYGCDDASPKRQQRTTGALILPRATPHPFNWRVL